MTEMNLNVLVGVSGKAITGNEQDAKNFEIELGSLMAKYQIYYLQVVLTPTQAETNSSPPEIKKR